ncbi:hypothetical protein CROQUDRAFT_90970 [Cronartium quercuum f. sp. fusiforme G11]|uniref:Uncharacterized protein n=1 Tax=Cronartium quercuum f. sp. fusiforme G11 TaxID=708437 RepID=A0A9P6NIY0_9BASI|nr:hypothetical protein CROQUDRAFT_90970 [Cronartium quercuum f. sp. fusiforme G11]
MSACYRTFARKDELSSLIFVVDRALGSGDVSLDSCRLRYFFHRTPDKSDLTFISQPDDQVQSFVVWQQVIPSANSWHNLCWLVDPSSYYLSTSHKRALMGNEASAYILHLHWGALPLSTLHIADCGRKLAETDKCGSTIHPSLGEDLRRCVSSTARNVTQVEESALRFGSNFQTMAGFEKKDWDLRPVISSFHSPISTQIAELCSSAAAPFGPE